MTELHAYLYVKACCGQFVGVVRANGHETETRPLPTEQAAQEAAAAMLNRLRRLAHSTRHQPPKE